MMTGRRPLNSEQGGRHVALNTRRIRRRDSFLQGIVGAALLAVVIGLAVNSARSTEPGGQLEQRNETRGRADWLPDHPSGRPGHLTELRGRTFFVPNDMSIVVSASRSAAFLVVALWPDFAPPRRDNVELVRRRNRNRLQISVRGEWFENLEITAVRGWRTARRTRLESSLGPYEEHPTALGLIEHRAVGMRPGYNDNLGRYDYYSPTDGDAQIYIFCASQLSVGYRMQDERAPCIMHLVTRDLYIQIRFMKHLLPEWREIVSGTEALLDDFEAMAEIVEPPAEAGDER